MSDFYHFSFLRVLCCSITVFLTLLRTKVPSLVLHKGSPTIRVILIWTSPLRVSKVRRKFCKLLAILELWSVGENLLGFC